MVWQPFRHLITVYFSCFLFLDFLNRYILAKLLPVYFNLFRLKVIIFFKKNPKTSFKSKEIAKRLKVKDDISYQLLKATLHQLESEQFLSRNGKRYKLYSLPDTNRMVGHFILNEWGLPERLALAIAGHHNGQVNSEDCPPPRNRSMNKD